LTKIIPLEHVLIYCDPEQIDDVMQILYEQGILAHRFTAREGLHERIEILRNFANRRYKVMTAMNCLDEGIDVPPTKVAIILASSSNPRQFIQRRGRILRLYPGKEEAIIYDFLTIPPLSDYNANETMDIERKIIRRELRRFNEFASTSINKFEARAIILDKVKRFGIDIL
jgi:superfamily II DNA or RNA helicase